MAVVNFRDGKQVILIAAGSPLRYPLSRQSHRVCVVPTRPRVVTGLKLRGFASLLARNSGL